MKGTPPEGPQIPVEQRRGFLFRLGKVIAVFYQKKVLKEGLERLFTVLLHIIHVIFPLVEDVLVKIDPQLPEQNIQRGIPAGKVEIQHAGKAHISVQQNIARVQVGLKDRDWELAVQLLQNTAIREKAGPYPLKPLCKLGELFLYDPLELQGALHDFITGVRGAEPLQNAQTRGKLPEIQSRRTNLAEEPEGVVMVNIPSVLQDYPFSKLVRRLKSGPLFRVHNAGSALIFHGLRQIPIFTGDDLGTVIPHRAVSRRRFLPDLYAARGRKIITGNFNDQPLIRPLREDRAAEILLPPAGVFVFPAGWRVPAIKLNYLRNIHKTDTPLSCYDRSLSSRHSRTSPSRPGIPRSSPRTGAAPPPG